LDKKMTLTLRKKKQKQPTRIQNEEKTSYNTQPRIQAMTQ